MVSTKRHEDDTYGMHVKVQYGDVIIIYAHLSKINVKENQDVMPWGLIGYMGNTGFSYGDHLHFEVNKDGIVISPYPYLP